MSPAPVVVVGAGPAGLAAARRLDERGIACTLIDDNATAGGQVWRSGGGLAAFVDRRGEQAREALHRRGGAIDHRPEHEVLGLFPPLTLWVGTPSGRRLELAPEALILAPGALEIQVPVPGWTLPGVYGVGGLQALAKSGGVVPCGPLVLAGAGPLLHLVAAQLATAGSQVAAVVDAAGVPGPAMLAAMATAPTLLARGMAFEFALRRRRVPVLRRHAVAAIEGHGTVSGVTVQRLDDDWRPVPGSERRIAARTVGIGFGVRPNLELTLLAGCEHRYARYHGGWVPHRDARFETSVPGLFLVGDAGGIEGVEAAVAQGTIAADAIASRLGAAPLGDSTVARARRRLRRLRRSREALAAWSRARPGIFDLCQGETIVCRCEDVTTASIEAAVTWGGASPHVVKMITRAGMGLCQGRTCAPAVQALIARQGGLLSKDVDLPSRRMPLRPVALSSLADPAAAESPTSAVPGDGDSPPGGGIPAAGDS